MDRIRVLEERPSRLPAPRRIIAALARPLPLAAALLLGALCLALGVWLGRSTLPTPFRDGFPDPGQASTIEDEIGVFWQAWKTLQGNFYVGPLDQQQLMRGAIAGMVEAAEDPNTYYLAPDKAVDHRDWLAGRFTGIGVSLAVDSSGAVSVKRVIPDSPAERAGLLPGDRIVQVDGIELSEDALANGLELIRGEPGSMVELDVYRADTNERLRVTIVRDEIIPPTVWGKVVDRYGIIELTRFGYRTATELGNEIVRLQEQDLDGLVLDLRGNGGGFLDSALGASSHFLPDGSTVAIQTQRLGPSIRHRTGSDGIALYAPLAVLVDANTASAAEVLAAALVDNSRATLVGTKTFGKGSVQVAFDLSDQSLIKVTVGKWLTAAGVGLDGSGLEPGVELADATGPSDHSSDDIYLQAALELLRNDPTCCVILPEAT